MAQEHHQFLVPLIGAGIWFGGLLAMIITWAAQGRPHYTSQDDSIPFISDIAADILKPLFIPVCVITASSFVLSFAMERRLRHVGRMPCNMRRREKVFAWLAICGALLGGVGLILLSIFDTKRHNKLHRVFLLIFVLGVALSAIFSVLEFRWLNKHYTYFPRLRRSYIAKTIIVFILIILAIAFGVTLGTRNNAAAVLEWVVAFGFTFYVLTFVYDLRLVWSQWVDQDSRSGSHDLVLMPEKRY
ncbi:Frag1/DRAM/Sfk1 [Gautieria morchelliformis]|nr:Frag1/DRAM/Sfk1 [Gautieria morchelliformis]